MNSDQILSESRDKMEKGVEFFRESLNGLRTGRVSPALVENIRVDAYGSPMPLNQLASISVPEPRTLLVKPFDPSMCTAIEKGILKGDIGIMPETDGKVVRLAVPMMSQEQRDKMTGRVKELAEQARVVVRNIRRDQNKAAETARKASELSEDLERDLKDEIQKLVKSMESEIDQIAAARTKEIQES
ncbi:MAG: ribosome recycling factor [Planctomycetota bacterium]|nr:ribosome recycling factor [Planctomycetota bacterium]